MKATLVIIVATLCLAGCHADRTGGTSPANPAPSASTATAKADKSLEKSRDAMLGKSADIASQHWATDPAAAATTMTPAVAPGTTSSPGTTSPAAASPASGAGRH
jgi:hypothetical protein